MPFYKYLRSRVLTFFENIGSGQNLEDRHSGFRVYKREVFEKIPLERSSNDFSFDSELIVQAAFHGFRIGDVSVPVRYFPEASSMDFLGNVKDGLRTLWALVKYLLHKWGIPRCPLLVTISR